MIVYGDPAHRESVQRYVEILDLMCEQAQAADPRPARMRALAERAGELEQALFDAPEVLPERERRRCLAGARRAASLAADAFDATFRHDSEAAKDAVRRTRASLRPIRGRGGSVTVKVPEGFAFYGLYPQCYRHEALVWARERETSPARDVLVVGIRSIGTTLSAVVAAALRARGFRVKRITVRPTGHPFERRLGALRPRAVTYGLVVDEGPGLSGSSMIAAADALERAGVREVSLIPAHDREPGPRATAEIRSRWRRFPRYPAAGAEVRFGERSLVEELWTGVRPAVGGDLARVHDLGGGGWRRMHYESERSWPAICRALERPKFLGVAHEGARVLFKFCGFATAPGLERTLAAQVTRRAAPLAARGFSPRLFGEAHGYVAWEWVNGRPLGIQDASFPLLGRVGTYIALAAGPRLSADAAAAARERLETMLAVNAEECLGAEAARAAASELRHLPPGAGAPQAGDGRLAPHEWIRARSGAVLKTDVGGHDVEHTWTGAQPVAWDLAGALEEWDLHGAQADALLRGYDEAGGERVPTADLHAYRVAYAAHRAGQSGFFASIETDPGERERLSRAFERWCGQLDRCLAEGPAVR